MMPGAVQLVNMRPNTPTAQTKTVATVSPRVVISSPHMVATRPANPGVSRTKHENIFALFTFYNEIETRFNVAHFLFLSLIQITLGQMPAGPQGQTLLLKTENGQYRLLHVGPQTAPQTLPNSGANSTIRIQTVPSVSTFAGPLALRKTIVTQQPLKTKANIPTNFEII